MDDQMKLTSEMTPDDWDEYLADPDAAYNAAVSALRAADQRHAAGLAAVATARAEGRADGLREAAAWCEDESMKCADAVKWGGSTRYVNDCKAADFALKNANAKILALIPAPQPDLHIQIMADPRVRALVDAGDVMANALRGGYIVPGSAGAWQSAVGVIAGFKEPKP